MVAVRVDSYKTIGFASISGTFAAVGTPLTHTWRAFRITNNTDGDMIFSFDQVNLNLFVPALTFVLYDLAANASTISSEDGLVLSKGTQFYVKQSSAPTTGSIYIEGFYAIGE